MAATARTGFTDTFHQNRLQHVTGNAYPAAPTGTYLALYLGHLPDSSGSGGIEATGTRPAITFGAPATDANNRFYITHTAAVTATLTNASAGVIVGFGIFSAATGGTPIYTGTLSPFQVQAGATVTIPAGRIQVFAEPPSY